MENYEYPYNLLMSVFLGGVSGIADLRKDRSTWESTAHGYLTISGYVWSCDSCDHHLMMSRLMMSRLMIIHATNVSLNLHVTASLYCT